jgi:arylsulfatase A-like enzyme
MERNRYGNSENLILVTVDTLRSDFLGVYGHEMPVSPNIDLMASRALIFERAYSTAPFTAPSHASILTAQHPSTHGVIFNGHRAPVTISEASVTIAEHLQAEGFETAAVVSAGPLHSKYGFGRGFDEYHLVLRPAHGDLGGDGAGVIQKAAEWLDSRRPGERFFLWIHLFDPHLQYISSKEVLEQLGLESDLKVNLRNAKKLPAETLRSAYRAEVYEMDRHFGSLQRHLESTGLDESTLIALTADHGEYLGEHGRNDHSQLYDEVLAVPLLIRPPGLKTQVRRTDVVSTVDLVPTLLDLLGVEPLPYAQGHSLLDVTTSDRAAYAEWRNYGILGSKYRPEPGDFLMSVQVDSRKYIYDVLVPQASQLYDLAEDPDESQNLLEAREEDLGRLRSIFAEHVREELPNGILGVSQVSIDDESREMLRSLGYLE